MAKSNSKRPTNRPESQWKKLSAQFPKSPHLLSEVLYALPAKLVTCIETHAPKVFTKSDVRFERALRRLSATGFYRRQPMFSELLDSQLLGSKSIDLGAITDHDERLDRRTQNRLRDALSADRTQKAQHDRRERLRKRIDQDIELRLRGYAGWLATHPGYWADVCTVQFVCERVLARDGEYPALTDRFQEPFLPSPRSNPGRRDAIARIQMLLDRWGLDSFSTFAIPTPMRPGIWTGDRFNPGTIVPDGLSLFLPWPMLVDGWITLQKLIELHRTRTDLRHLEEWLNDSNSLGVKRCARMLEIYIYRELALSNRYAKQLRGQTEPLDRAFAAYFRKEAQPVSDIDKGLESVRKLRRILRNRLETCKAATAQRLDQLKQGHIEPPEEAARADSLLQELEADVAEFRSRGR